MKVAWSNLASRVSSPGELPVILENIFMPRRSKDRGRTAPFLSSWAAVTRDDSR